jgi:hypothetical protein
MPPLPSLERLLVRLALEELNAEFAYRVDHGLEHTVADLFVPQGCYMRADGSGSRGREAIRATFARRRERGARTARHIFTNLRISFETENRVSGTSIMTLYAEDGPPPHPPDVLAVSDFVDVYVRGADGRWLYESRTIHSLFIGSRPTVLPFAEEPSP